MHQTNNLRVLDATPLLSPDGFKSALPITEEISALVYHTRNEVRDIIHGRDPRLLCIVGPCSVHDPLAAVDYARKLVTLREQLADDLVIVMRVYFEKPRTTVGWKGLINDPRLDGTYDIPLGLSLARRILLDVTSLGLPTATEMLDPIIPQYLADLVTWAAIGARTTESQTHREMSSGLSMPVGFKNATDGGVEVAVNAVLSAAHSHRFLGVDGQGLVSVVRTAGNPDCHLVLRGGAAGPNYDEAAVDSAKSQLIAAKATPYLMIDASHDNSGKSYEKQPAVAEAIADQVSAGQASIIGVMLESNLVAGKQPIAKNRKDLTYGKSITDGCIDMATTERLLIRLAQASRQRRERGSSAILARS